MNLKQQAIESIDSAFEGVDPEQVIENVLTTQTLSPIQEFFFLRSIANQKLVGIQNLFTVDFSKKIKTSNETLEQLLYKYAERHKTVITGNIYPSYSVASNIIDKKSKNLYYLAKLCRDSKKQYPSIDWYWSDFCFPKNRPSDEVMTSNAMAWSVFAAGITKPKTDEGDKVYSFASGIRAATQAYRESWSLHLTYELDKDNSIEKWKNNVSDHEREKQILKSSRLTYKRDPSIRPKVLTEAHVNKEWYIRHFDVSTIKPSIQADPQPFLVPTSLAPFDWVEMILRFFFYNNRYAIITNEELIKSGYKEVQQPYAKKIPFFGMDHRILPKMTDQHGQIIFNIYNNVGLWK